MIQAHMRITRHICAPPLPVYMVAFDHRNSFQRTLSQIGIEARGECRAALKQCIWQGVQDAVALIGGQGSASVLIDRGNWRIVEEAKTAGVPVALALEKSGCSALQPEASTIALRRELCKYRPEFGKVLIRWHPEDSASRKQRQAKAMLELSELVLDADADLLLEMLVQPRPPSGRITQSTQIWEDVVLPQLQLQAIEEILKFGVSPTLWKIEGHANAQAAGRIAALVASSRPDASLLILGGGSEITDLHRLFACRAGNERLRGFAVGRSIWEAPIMALCKGEVSKFQAQDEITRNLLTVIETFDSAAQVPVGPY